MRLIIVGSGRAAGSMALAATQAGHEIVGVLARDEQDLGPALPWGSRLPEADVLLLAVSDDAVAEVADALVPIAGAVPVAAHMSGFVPVVALRNLQENGLAIGGFHPLVSMPTPTVGAASLRGGFVGIGGDPLAVDALTHLAGSLGLETFRLEDEARPAYHAAAAAAANFVVASLALSADLFGSASVDPKVSRPLVERVVANCFDVGPTGSLTGPIARGDVETVIGHLTAAHDVSEVVGEQFKLMVEATAIRAGRERDLHEWR